MRRRESPVHRAVGTLKPRISPVFRIPQVEFFHQLLEQPRTVVQLQFQDFVNMTLRHIAETERMGPDGILLKRRLAGAEQHQHCKQENSMFITLIHLSWLFTSCFHMK